MTKCKTHESVNSTKLPDPVTTTAFAYYFPVLQFFKDAGSS